jgi:hypothetical protein
MFAQFRLYIYAGIAVALGVYAAYQKNRAAHYAALVSQWEQAAKKAQSERDNARIDFNIRLSKAAEEYAKSLEGVNDEKNRAVVALRNVRVRLQSCAAAGTQPDQAATNPASPDTGPTGQLSDQTARNLAALMADANAVVAERNLAAQLLRACYSTMEAP